MLLLYLVICTIIIYFIFFKLKHPFWSRQPVFHFHNLYYRFMYSGIITNNPELKHIKYYDTSISLNRTNNIEDKTIDSMVSFIQNNYTKEKDIIYTPTKENILSYLNSKAIIGLKTNHTGIIGCITGRPLNCYISKTKKVVTINYVDYLCVHKNYRGMNLAPSLIYTFYMYLVGLKRETVCLFKKEGVLSCFVPLCTYDCYTYNIEKSLLSNTIITKEISIDVIYNNTSALKTKFKLFVLPPAEHLATMTDVDIYGIHNLTEIYCLFFFRKTYSSIFNKETVELFTSVNNINNEQFIMAFCGCHKMFENKTLIVENIGDNDIIIDFLNKSNEILFKYQCGYYFYNYALSTIPAKSCLIIA